MSCFSFKKFEMKYGYYLPETFKRFMDKFGGDAQFGSCRFEYPENIANNILRVPGKMDFHLLPFGDVGNGDYYCFYKYGERAEDYFVGIWLHETSNFVILTSSFDTFLYKCVLDDYLTTILPNDEFPEAENELFIKECLERSELLSKEYGFDYEKIKSLADEYDYHEFLADMDPGAIQSHCYVGLQLLKNHDERGLKIVEGIKNTYKPYIAPHYLLGRALTGLGKDGGSHFLEGLHGSMILTGYSYWEEDYLGIPEDVHRELELYVDSRLEISDDLLQNRLFEGKDPYDWELRMELARSYVQSTDWHMAMVEFNNAIFCCNKKEKVREILNEALEAAGNAGMGYLVGIIENDIRKIRITSV